MVVMDWVTLIEEFKPLCYIYLLKVSPPPLHPTQPQTSLDIVSLNSVAAYFELSNHFSHFREDSQRGNFSQLKLLHHKALVIITF